MRRANIEVHIEELVLDGFAHVNQAQLGAMVREELTRLLTNRGMSAALSPGGEVTSLDDVEFYLVLGSDTRVIGLQIAQAVYGGLKR